MSNVKTTKVCRRIALAILSATLLFPASVYAQEKVVMASWGGGGALTIKRAFGEPFTKATSLPVELMEVPDPSAAIAAAQGRPSFNVAIAASFQAAALARRGLIEELTVDDLPAIKSIPEKYWVKANSGKLVGMPVWFQFYGVAYNTDLAKATEFSSWTSLADKKFRKRISVTRPVFSAPYDLTLFAKINGGDEKNIQPGTELFKAIAGNTLSVYTSMASFQSQLSRGEMTAAPYYSSQVMMTKRAGVKNIDIVIPKEGGLALSYVYVIPKGAKDIDAAKRFINSVVEKDAQLRAAEDGTLPLNPQAVLPEHLVKEIGYSLQEVMDRTYSPDWNVVASHLDERLTLVEKLMDEAQ